MSTTKHTTAQVVDEFGANIMGAIDAALQEEMGDANVNAYTEARVHIDRIVQCVKSLEGIENPAGLLPLLRLCLAQLDVATGANPETTAAKKLRAMIGELPMPTGPLGSMP